MLWDSCEVSLIMYLFIDDSLKLILFFFFFRIRQRQTKQNMDSIGADPAESQSFIQKKFLHLSRVCQTLLDQTTPFIVPRWSAVLVFYAIFWIRIIAIQGWFIICYALAIYHLNLFIAFLTPNIDPGLRGSGFDDDGSDGPLLPDKNNQEFRPFQRRLPEFKFWYSTIKAIIIAFCTTFFEAFNVPVFWPILVMYFFILFFLTMKRQIAHMIKYKYLPFTTGKKKYSSDNAGKVTVAN